MRRLLLLIVWMVSICFVMQMKASPFVQDGKRRDILLSRSDSLFAAGVDLYRQDKYKEAIPLFEESDRIDKAELDSTSNRRDYSAMWMASCYYHLGDTATAQSIHEYYRFAPVDRRLTVQSDSLSALGVACYERGDYEEALKYFKSSGEIEGKVVGKKHVWYLGTINSLVNCFHNLKDSIQSFKHQALAENITKHNYGVLSTQYLDILSGYGFLYDAYNQHLLSAQNYEKGYTLSDSLHLPEYCLHFAREIADEYGKLRMNNEAIDWGTKTLAICESLYGKRHPYYSNDLSKLAIYYANAGDNKKAIELDTEALRLCKRIYGEKHLNCAISLENLMHYSLNMEDYKNAIFYGQNALNTYKALSDENSPVCISIMKNVADCYFKMGDYKEAIQISFNTLNAVGKFFGKESTEYIASLYSLASYEAYIGNFDDATNLITNALSICELFGGDSHIYYSTLMSSLASYNFYVGKYVEALQFEEEALNSCEKILGKKHLNYGASLNNLALYNFSLGNYAKAVKLGIEAVEVTKIAGGIFCTDYASSLANLANYYFHIGNHSKAKQISLKALNVRTEILRNENSIEAKFFYAQSLANIAGYNWGLGNYTESIQLATKALDIYGKVLGNTHPDYATILSNLGVSYWGIGNCIEAIQAENDALNIRRNILGKAHPDYALSLSNLALYYYYTDNHTEATKLYAEVTTLYSDLILSTFADLTPYEQSMFWSKYYNYFNTELPQRAYALSNDSLYASAYNGILLSKGLLLNAETEMKKLLQESGDTAVVTLYEQARTNRILLNKTLERPVNERYFNVDSLQRLIKRQEQELIQRSKTYGDFTHNLAINWQEVQKELDATDIAVEFLAFPTGKDSVMYAALTLKQGAELPEMVPLFEEEQLKQIVPSNLYSTTDLYKLVWQPMEEKLKGVKNIYFAPSGELYNIAIESLPDTDSTLVSDRFNLYRLSSTRQLALVGENHEGNGARIYGGLKYDTGVSQLVKDNLKYKRDESLVSTRSFEDSFIADSLHLRSGAEELPGTKIEAENIKRSLDRAHVKNELYTDTIGTEASFKAMSGKRIKTLHIATHGFYWTEREAQQLKKLNFLQLDDNNRSPYVEDKALTRSGLLMSGANNALMGIEMPQEIDNGILTAKEIAGLDLRGLDLVVLSACQTGLGEITGDGVFGLQRGFKKAGAQSLLMSLWKVDDQATQMLMTQFYANLIKGQSKYEALREAQRYVRDYETEETVIVNEVTPSQKRRMERQGITWEAQKEVRKIHPYAHPKYWAAFILLDAVN